jgi:hypothetical protein
MQTMDEKLGSEMKALTLLELNSLFALKQINKQKLIC